MAGKTPPELNALSDVQPDDLLVAWRGSGPLSSVTYETLTNSLSYDDGEAGSVSVPITDLISSEPLNAKLYGYVPDGVDRSAEFSAFLEACVETGREGYVPPGTYRHDNPTRLYLDQQLPYSTSFRKGVRIRGAGSGRWIIDSRVPNDWVLDISVGDGSGGEYPFPTFAGILGGYIQGLTIIQGAATANSNGIRMRAYYQPRLIDIHIQGLSGTGIKTRGGVGVVSGDYDSNNQVLFEDIRVDNCGVWGIDTGNDAPFNENSSIVFDRTFVQNCGTAEEKAITGITKANPGVVTAVGHGFSNGQRVFLAMAGGMTEVNSPVAARSYVVTVIDPDNFSIGVDTSGGGYTAYTSGGYAFPATPSSGGTRIRGQIVTFINSAWTINKNRSVWVDGNGGGVPQDIFFIASTIENPRLIGLHVQGGRTVLGNGLHIYTSGLAAGGPEVWGHLYDGEQSLVSDIRMFGVCVRTTSHANEADLTIAQAIGSNVLRDSIIFDNQSLQLKQFGANNQRLFRGLNYQRVPQQCRVTVTSSTTVVLRPDPTFTTGNRMPLRITYGGAGGATFASGPWTEAKVESAGVSKTNAGLAASTLYYVYFFTEGSGTNAQQIEFSTTAPVYDDSGYPVKTGENWKLCCTDAHGVPTRIRTDAGSLFATTGSSFCAPTEVSSDQVGVSGLTWVSAADRKLYYKGNPALPGSATAGEWSYWPSFETGVAYDPPSLAAGAETTVDVTVVCAAGDFCTSVGFSTGWGGLVAFGSVKAANTITAYIKNPTAGVIDLASGTIRTVHQRR